MDSARAYEIAGLILSGSCIEGVPPHKGQQIADRIASILVSGNLPTESEESEVLSRYDILKKELGPLEK